MSQHNDAACIEALDRCLNRRFLARHAALLQRNRSTQLTPQALPYGRARATAAAQTATYGDTGDGNDCPDELDEEEREFATTEDEKARARLQAENSKGGEDFLPWALTGISPNVSVRFRTLYSQVGAQMAHVHADACTNLAGFACVSTKP